MITNLPEWVLPHMKPSFNDLESATAIEMVYKLYGKNQELIDDYNKFLEDIRNEVNAFKTSTNQDMECFKAKITKICNDYIATMDKKIDCQDRKIAEAVKYMKDNIKATVTEIIAEMKEKGEIDEAILNVFDNIGTRFENLYVESIEEMKNTEYMAGDVVKTLGYYQANDGGQGLYRIREKQETDVEDGGSIHVLLNGLVAELIIENNSVNIKQFGAKGDKSDETDKFQKAIDYLKSNNAGNLILPYGNYGVTHIDIGIENGGLSIIGTNLIEKIYNYEKTASIIGLASDEESVISIKGTGKAGVTNFVSGVTLKNIRVTSDTSNGNRQIGIDCANCTRLEMENVEIAYFDKYGLSLVDVFDSYFDKMFLHQNGIDENSAALYMDGKVDNTNAIRLTNSHFESNTTNLITKLITQILISNCKFEDREHVAHTEHGTIRLFGSSQISFTDCIFTNPLDYYQIVFDVSDSSVLNTIRTNFVNCQFNLQRNGRAINFNGAVGGSINSCTFRNIPNHNCLKLSDGQSFVNNNMWLYNAEKNPLVENVIECGNKVKVKNNVFYTNYAFAEGSYFLGITGSKNVIKENSFNNVFTQLVRYQPGFNTNNEIEPYYKNEVYNLIAEKESYLDARVIENIMYSIANGVIESIANPFQNAEIHMYINTSGVTVAKSDSMIPNSRVDSFSLNSSTWYKFKYLNKAWFIEEMAKPNA